MEPKPSGEEGEEFNMHIDVEYLPSSVKFGDIIGKVFFENSDGDKSWAEVVYNGGNTLRLRPITTIQ